MSFEKAQQIIDQTKASNSKTLDISDLSLTADDLSRLIKSNFEFFKVIENLNVGFNHLTTLPSEIKDLTQLKELILNCNLIETLPREIGMLTQLESLGVYDNRIRVIPPEIGNLKNLTDTTFQENRLETLPAEIENLSELVALRLENNLLRTLPSEIGNLSKLEDLYLEDNALTHLPLEIGSLLMLEKLCLDRCNLREVPNVIERLTNLTELRLTGNPLTEATMDFLDILNERDNLEVDYDMSDHEQEKDFTEGLDKLYSDPDMKKSLLDKIESLKDDEKEAMKTFLSKIQNSKYWYNDDLFNRYFKATIRNMLSQAEYNEDGRANHVLKDIVKSSSGCATNSTGTVLAYYAKSVILNLQEKSETAQMQYTDLAKIDDSLRSDIIHIALQEYTNALINENYISGDRAEIIADLLRMVRGASFSFIAPEHKISNPLTLPESISGYGLTANNKAKAIFLANICNTRSDNSLDISSNGELVISEEKLEFIVNNYLSLHGLNISDKKAWFLALSSILQDPEMALLDNDLRDVNESIRAIYKRLYCEFHQEILGNEFISDLIDLRKYQTLLQDVTSEAEYLNKVLNGLTETLGKVNIEAVSRHSSQQNSLAESLIYSYPSADEFGISQDSDTGNRVISTKQNRPNKRKGDSANETSTSQKFCYGDATDKGLGEAVSQEQYDTREFTLEGPPNSREQSRTGSPTMYNQVGNNVSSEVLTLANSSHRSRGNDTQGI